MPTRSYRLRNRAEMQLSLHADYALRTLIYLGTHRERLVSTQEISDTYGISKFHLVRVVQTLSHHGYVTAQTGRGGGLTLAREPSAIRIGAVIRDAEPNLILVECFDRESNTCPIVPACSLKQMFSEALDAFLKSLDRHTLADILDPASQKKLLRLLSAAGLPI